MQVNPAMIALARESRGWTQKQFAEAIGERRLTVCKYELGQLRVNDEVHGRMANALQYHPSFFTQTDTVYGIGSTFLFHRKRASIPMKVQNRVQAEVNVRRMQAARLLRAGDFEHEYSFPAISPEEFDNDPERVAREVRRMWRIPRGPIACVTKVAEDAGGIVFACDFNTTLIDGVHLWVPTLPPMFFMNDKVPGERHRFNLAHEIGHAVMHQRSAPFGDFEDEANQFAAEFLMPRTDIFHDLAGLTLDSAARLKRVWGVSMQALIRRAFDTRQIRQSAYARMMTRLSASGGRTSEPWPLPFEKPTTLDTLEQYHEQVIGLSRDEIDELMMTRTLGPLPPDVARPLRLVRGLSLFDATPPSPPNAS